MTRTVNLLTVEARTTGSREQYLCVEVQRRGGWLVSKEGRECA